MTFEQEAHQRKARVSNASHIRALESEAVRALVADAIAMGRILIISRACRELWRTYGQYGISMEEIYDEIVEAAIGAGVPMEISRPPQPQEC
jgi:hypothetical protein